MTIRVINSNSVSTGSSSDHTNDTYNDTNDKHEAQARDAPSSQG